MTKSEEEELCSIIFTFPLITLKELADEFDIPTIKLSRKLAELGIMKAWYRFEEPRKRCPKCKAEKPRDEFGVSNKALDGKQLYCMQCNNNNSRRQRIPERKPAKPEVETTDGMSKDEKRKYWADKLNKERRITSE